MKQRSWTRSLDDSLVRQLAHAGDERVARREPTALPRSEWEVDSEHVTSALRRARGRVGPAISCPLCDALTPLENARGPLGHRSLLCKGCGDQLLPAHSHGLDHRVSSGD